MKFVAITATLLLFTTVFGWLFYLPHIDMQTGMADCPFMMEQEVICPMDLAAHLEALQSIFTVTMPTILLLFGTAVFILLTVSRPQRHLYKLYDVGWASYKQLQEKNHRFDRRSLQSLFADGILHPKLF